MTLKSQGIHVDHQLDRQNEQLLISPFQNEISTETLKEYIIAGATAAANHTSAFTTRKLAEMRRAFVERKHQADIRRERVERYFSSRHSLTNNLTDRLRTILSEVKKPGNESIDRTVQAGVGPVFGKNSSSAFVAHVKHDSTQMAHDLSLLLTTLEHSTNTLKDIFAHLNLTTDSEFERSFIDRLKTIRPYALHNVFVGPHQYLGGYRIEAPNASSPNDLHVPANEFVRAYRATGLYEFKHVEEHGTDNLGLKDELTLTASDVQLLHMAAKLYLEPVANVDKITMKLFKELQDLEVTAHLIRIGDHPKHREIGLRRYKENFNDLESVLQPSLRAIEKIIEPMYANMQRKAMTLLHVCEKWLRA